MSVEGIRLLALAMVLVYFVPTVVAFSRKRRNAVAISALNVLGGWTVIGWIAALVWSLTADARREA